MDNLITFFYTKVNIVTFAFDFRGDITENWEGVFCVQRLTSIVTTVAAQSSSTHEQALFLGNNPGQTGWRQTVSNLSFFKALFTCIN